MCPEAAPPVQCLRLSPRYDVRSMWSLPFGLQIVKSPKYKEPAEKRKAPECVIHHTNVRTDGLAGAGLHERLLDVRGEELPPPARGATARLRVAVRNRSAGFAPKMSLAASCSDDGRRFGQELADLAELAGEGKGIDPRPGLIRFDQAI